jgi:hypothetical protein
MEVFMISINSKNRRRMAGMIGRSVVCAIAIFSLANGVVSTNGAQDGARQKKADGQQKRETKKQADEANHCPVLWQEPTDIERRDLYYGLGGQSGAPNPAGKFTFVGDKGSPKDSNPKIDVKDDQGREWTVKFGPEVKSETAVSRIVWAAGYHVDQVYFVEKVTIEGFNRIETRNMRFEREDDGLKTVGRWDWKTNPFIGTRELDGLKTLMALVQNVDLSQLNNRIARVKKNGDDSQPDIYYVNDLGASLGSTGAWYTRFPWLDKARSESKGVPKDFVKNGFISGVKKDEIDFRITRRLANQILDGVKVEHARWMGNLLGRLSEKQLTDAFRAGGFTDSEVAIYVDEIRKRITQLQNLDSGNLTTR